MAPRKAVLGIDLGSTGMRAWIACPELPENERDIPVVDRQGNNRYNRHEPGNFSAAGYPFEPYGPVYPRRRNMSANYEEERERCETDRVPISLKYAFYCLANASDELLEQYPLLAPLNERRNDQQFRARLSQGLRELFTMLHDYVRNICTNEGLAISAIGLSIPSQWTLDFEEVYREIVAHAFRHPPSDIFFHTETEALAHCLLEVPELRKKLQVGGPYDVFLFLDFGGHNMNGCIFGATYGSDASAPSLFRIGEAFGVGGGSEHWEYSIGEVCADFIFQDRGETLPPKVRQVFLDQFNVDKMNRGPGGKTGMFNMFYCEDNGGPQWQVSLDAEAINMCFERAHERPVRIAAEHVAQVASYSQSKVRVVVSGGSCRNQSLRQRIAAMCEAASLAEPVFTHEIDHHINSDTSRIARGVAYAAASPTTVEDFLRRGAAFGLQKRQGGTGDANSENLWDDEARFLCSLTSDNIRVRDCASGRDEVKIVCDPFFGDTPDQPLRYPRMYDVYSLGVPLRGSWLYVLSVKGTGDDMFLELKLHRQYGSKQFRFEPIRLPLQFDRGTNCVQVGERGHTLEELQLDMASQESLAGYFKPPMPRAMPGTKPSGPLRHLPRVDPYKEKDRRGTKRRSTNRGLSRQRLGLRSL